MNLNLLGLSCAQSNNNLRLSLSLLFLVIFPFMKTLSLMKHGQDGPVQTDVQGRISECWSGSVNCRREGWRGGSEVSASNIAGFRMIIGAGQTLVTMSLHLQLRPFMFTEPRI